MFVNHAITIAVKKWRQYLLGHSFVILTDHRSLKELMSQIVQTPEQHKYLTKLMGYDFTIQYRSDSSNIVADALSRTLKTPTGMVFLLSVPHFTFLTELKNELAARQEFVALQKSLQDEPLSHSEYNYNSGLILKKGCIWLPNSLKFIHLFQQEFHSTPTGRHMGITKTLSIL